MATFALYNYEFEISLPDDPTPDLFGHASPVTTAKANFERRQKVFDELLGNDHDGSKPITYLSRNGKLTYKHKWLYGLSCLLRQPSGHPAAGHRDECLVWQALHCGGHSLPWTQRRDGEAVFPQGAARTSAQAFTLLGNRGRPHVLPQGLQQDESLFPAAQPRKAFRAPRLHHQQRACSARQRLHSQFQGTQRHRAQP